MFRRLDYPLWRATAHNPVRMLRMSRARRSRRAARDPEFLALYDGRSPPSTRARGATDTWWARTFPRVGGQSIAYFSAEFALHQSLPIYAGGLGVLAGDHCKEASDLGVPLIGVGFMYPQGYFHQHVSAEGWQEESYERLNWADAPIEPAITPDGKPCITAVPLGDRSVLVAVWRVRLGPREAVSARHRPRRERAVGSRALGAPLRRRSRDAHPAGNHPRHRRRPGAEGARFDPSVFHLNEGHAGFVVLQRIRELIERGKSFDDALDDSGARRSSRRTRRCRPGTTPSRSIWSRSTSRGAGARSARTCGRDSSRSANTTTAAACSST